MGNIINILLLNLPTKFFIYPYKKYLDMMEIEDEEYSMTKFRKFYPDMMKDFSLHLRTSNEVYEYSKKYGNVDFFDLDARLVKKYKRIDRFLNDLSDEILNEFINEIELKYDRYDYLLFSFIREPATGANYIFSLQIKFAMMVVSYLKKMFPNAKTILGGSGFGYTIGSMKGYRSDYSIESFSPFIDYIHIGQLNEEIMDSIIEGRYEDVYIQKSPPFPPAKAHMPTNVDDYRYTTNEILDFFDIKEKLSDDRYITMAESTLHKGCSGKCAFCLCSPTKLEFMDFDILKDMIMSYLDAGINSFYFLNNGINPIARKFCNWVAQKNLKFYFIDGSLHSLNPDYFKMLYECGCRSLHFGIETTDNDTLKYIQKGFTHEEMRESIKLSHDAGIWNIASVIINLPYSKPNNNVDTFNFLLEYEEYLQSVSPFHFYLFEYSMFGLHPEKYGLKYMKIGNNFVWKEINGNRGFTDVMKSDRTNFLTDDFVNSNLFNFIPYHLVFALYDYYDNKKEVINFLERNGIRK